MRYLVGLFLSIVISMGQVGCDQRSAQNPGAGLPASAAQGHVAQQLVAPAVSEGQPTLEDAIAFIQSRLGEHQLNSGYWSTSDVKLSSVPWTWRERMVTARGKDQLEAAFNATIVEESYSVAPSALTLPVVVEGRSLTFECREAKCISVQAYTMRPASGMDPIDIKETRAKNTWHFSDEQEANRVAKALTRALELHGAKRSKF